MSTLPTLFNTLLNLNGKLSVFMHNTKSKQRQTLTIKFDYKEIVAVKIKFKLSLI